MHKPIFSIIVFVCILVLTFTTISFSQELSVEIKTDPDKHNLSFEVAFEAIINGGTPKYSCTWNFGDGGSSTLFQPKHIFKEMGQYPIYLIVFDSVGNMAVTSKTINIVGNPEQFDPANINIEKFFSGNDAICVTHDNENPSFLWIVNGACLVRLNTINEKMEHIDLSDYGSINSMIQSHDDSFWIATSKGLLNYNYKTDQRILYNSTNSNLPDVSINSLYQSSDGAIWIGTHGDGIARYDHTINHLTVYNPSNSPLPGDIIYTILQSSDGAMWIATGRGLARFSYSDNQWEIYNEDNSEMPDRRISSVIQSSDNALWVGTFEGLARFSYETNHWKNYDYITDNTIDTLLETSDGNIWIGTYRALINFSVKNNSWESYKTNTSEFPDCHSIVSLAQTSDDVLWVGTIWSGLVKFSTHTAQWTALRTANNHLPYNEIPALFQSSNNDLWIGSYFFEKGGLLSRFSYDANQWVVYDQSMTDKYNLCMNAITQTTDGNIWIGSCVEGLAQLNSETNQWVFYTEDNSALPDNYVNALLQSKDGALWIGTNDGLARFSYKTNQWSTYTTGNSGLTSNWISCLIQSSDGAIWIGTYKAGLVKLIYDTKQWTTYGTGELSTSYIKAILESADGGIWVGTSNGLFHYLNDQWSAYNEENSSLSNKSVNALIQSSDGAIWIGTGFGLSRFSYDTNEWSDLQNNNMDFSNKIILSLIQSSDDAIWIGTQNDGLFRLSYHSQMQSIGKLIIIPGGGPAKSNTLWPTTLELATSTYRIFNQRGFSNSDIFFMSPVNWVDINGDGFSDSVVDIPTLEESRELEKDDIQFAITQWAVQNNTPDLPLFISLIDHGIKANGTDGPGFLISPGHILYANELNSMLEIYEEKTGGNVVVMIESCYSGQFLKYLAKEGRIIITSSDDTIVNYDSNGANSFTHYFLEGLYKNKTINQSFAFAIHELRRSDLTMDQKPQLDDNGDGHSDNLDGLITSNMHLGGDFVTGSPWPEIITITHSQTTEKSVSFSVSTNFKMKAVWSSVQPPDYIPNNDPYQDVSLEKFRLYDNENDMIYQGDYSGLVKTGNYIFTFYAKDSFNNVSVSDPVNILSGTTNLGRISGKIVYAIGDIETHIGISQAMVYVSDNSQPIKLDSNGVFSNYLPEGTYTITIQVPNFDSIIIPNIHVIQGEKSDLSTIKIPLTQCNGINLIDMNDDQTINLKDAIRILQVLSGVSH
jgi:ligand-binding sensor domain-containing protein